MRSLYDCWVILAVILYMACSYSLRSGSVRASSYVVDRTRQQPHRRCHGGKMYYTPLILNTERNRPILGVCDSSCLPINSTIHSMLHPQIASAVVDHSFLWYCDDTITLPENDLDPKLHAHKFPFHARTCFVDRSLDRGVSAQIEFEKVRARRCCRRHSSCADVRCSGL